MRHDSENEVATEASDVVSNNPPVRDKKRSNPYSS